MFRIIPILLLLFTILSCKFSNSTLTGHYYSGFSASSEQVNPNTSNDQFKGRFTRESFLDFFEDGTYSIYLNSYEHGKYKMVNDTIIMQSSDGHQWNLVYKQEKELTHFIFPTNKTLVTLRKLPNEVKDDYPFTIENNLWRIQKNKSLSNNQIIEKFQAYNLFMIHFMRWSKNNKQNLSFRQISGPLQFANNGLMMRKLKETGQWCSYFIEDDCLRSDAILREYFEDLIIDWKYTNDRIAMLCDALRQVNKGIENHKEHFTK